MHKKQLISIVWHPICLVLFCLFISLPQFLSAQEDKGRFTLDSVRVKHMEGFQLPKFELLPPKATPYPANPAAQPVRLPDFSLRESYALPYYTNPSPLFLGDFSTNGVWKQFPDGVLFGSGRQVSMPGLGRYNEAALGYLHTFNSRLAFQIDVNTMKMNMSHITRAALSTSGTLMYQLSDNVGFKVFGTYDIGNSYGMSTNSYGASMTFDMSERFSLETGVQRYYDDMRGRWVTVPIVTPTYHFKKFDLGLDVGGIIYEVLRNVVFDRRDNREGPTVGPPRLSLPIR